MLSKWMAAWGGVASMKGVTRGRDVWYNQSAPQVKVPTVIVWHDSVSVVFLTETFRGAACI